MITITGNVKDLHGSNESAYVEVQLCGFGSQLPRVSGSAMIANVDPLVISASSGSFSFDVYGNDVIIPAGTFYMIRILDAGKNVVQTANYQFVGSGSQDLSSVSPYNPNPTPAAAPTVQGGIVPVAFSASAQFDAASVTGGIITFEMTLTGDVTSPTVIHTSSGQIVIFSFTQDGSGGHSVTWPSNVKNASPIDTTANATSVQAFYARANGDLYPFGPMTVN